MKSILLYANEDPALDRRLDAAIGLAARFEATIRCVQVTPYESFIMGDPFGGVYALPSVVEQLGEQEEANRARAEDRLRAKGARWEWAQYEGHPGHVLLERSRLADLIIVSPPQHGREDRSLSLAADLAIHAAAPVLVLPSHGTAFACDGEAMVAWNGSPESAHALRRAVPLLACAKAVHLVTIAGGQLRLTAAEASDYLALHGIRAEPHQFGPEKETVADALLDAAARLDAEFVVAGAYGHSRLREAIIGGVTRELIARSAVPLLLAH